MSLYDKIIKLYPSLNQADFNPFTGTIMLQNDSDGKGDYIKSWKNSNPEPTAEQLAEIV
jgi:XkdW protein